MRRLKLLNDNVLGILLRIALGIEKTKDGTIRFAFYKDQLAPEEQLHFALLAKEKLLEVKTTLSPKTFIEGNYYKKLLIQKSQAAIVGSGHSYSEAQGIKYLREQADTLERFLNYLKRKYGENKNIEYEDINRMSKDFPEIEKTLFLHLTFSPQQVAKIKGYLKRYYKQYAGKDLNGQEVLPLPDIYAKTITSKINNPQFINTFGVKRIIVSSANMPLFCHSTFYLYQRGSIKIHDIELSGAKVNNIIIDNLNTGATPIQSEVPPKQTSNLQERYKQLINEIKVGVKGSNISHREDTQEQEEPIFPPNWELVEEDGIPKIKSNKLTIFIFPNNWSNKYKYFNCLWKNYGVKKSYKEVYEFKSKLKYPEKSVWRTNRNMRNAINKLRKEFKNKNLPLHIETSKGFTLTIF